MGRLEDARSLIEGAVTRIDRLGDEAGLEFARDPAWTQFRQDWRGLAQEAAEFEVDTHFLARTTLEELPAWMATLSSLRSLALEGGGAKPGAGIHRPAGARDDALQRRRVSRTSPQSG